jgi:hypothetical protein
MVTDCELPLPVDDSDRFDLDQYSGRASVSAHHGICRLWPANRPRPGCVDGQQVLAPVTSDVDSDLRDLPGAGARGGKRAAEIGEPRPGLAARPGPFLLLACAVLASLADLQADGPAPSWLVRVGTCLALHFPGDNPGLCLDRPGLLIWELGRRLFTILPGLAAKETHSAAKETHGVIIGRRLAGFSHLGLRGRSAGRSTCVSYLPEAAGRVARLRVPRWPAGRPPLPPPRRCSDVVPRRARPALRTALAAVFRSRPAAVSGKACSLPVMPCEA